MTRTWVIFTRHFSKANWDSGATSMTRTCSCAPAWRWTPSVAPDYYREIQEIVWQAVPIIPPHTIKVVVLARANVSGLVVHADEELGLASVKRRP